MPKDHHTENKISSTITNALLGAGVRSDLNSWKQEFDRKIRERIEHLATDINDIKSMMQAYFPSPVATADTAISRIIALTDMAKADLFATGEFKKAALRYLNAFQIKHNIDRMLIIAKPSESAVFLAGMAVVEGIATALFFLGGGFTAGIGEALGLGLTISSVNVLLSACVGGFIRRYRRGASGSKTIPYMVTSRFWARSRCT